MTHRKDVTPSIVISSKEVKVAAKPQTRAKTRAKRMQKSQKHLLMMTLIVKRNVLLLQVIAKSKNKRRRCNSRSKAMYKG